MAKKADKEIKYLIGPNGDGYVITKTEFSEGSVKVLAEYEVTRSSCTCKAFEIHNRCKHHDMVFMQSLTEPHSISVKEAQAAMRVLVRDMRTMFKTVMIPMEPYKRDSKDKIISLELHVSNPLVESAIKPGTWSGKLKGCGIIGIVKVI